jgi:hypothetical protein
VKIATIDETWKLAVHIYQTPEKNGEPILPLNNRFEKIDPSISARRRTQRWKISHK